MIVSDNIFWRILRFFQFDRIYRKFKGSTGPSLDRSRDGIPWTNIPAYDKELESKFRLAWTRLLEMGVSPGYYIEFCETRGRALACMLRVVDKLELSKVRLISVETSQHAPHGIGPLKDNIESQGIETRKTASTRTEGQSSAKNQVIEASLNDCRSGEPAINFGLSKASVIMIDCNQYEATRKALNFAETMILDHAMIFINNCHDDNESGESVAYAEFLKDNSHLKSLSFRTYKPSGRIFCVTSVKLE